MINGELQSDNQILVSVLMTVYNDLSVLDIAIKSVIHQTYPNWEMLILDNSDNNPNSWTVLTAYAVKDERIKVFKSPGHNGKTNVGWCKGTEILLEKAKGKYAFLLAADDFIDEHSFLRIANESSQNDPDVIWIGNAYTTYENGKFEVIDAVIPEYKVFTKEDNPEKIDYILKNVYYNSMFHYSKVDFLKKYNINFFYPYYKDCASMTAALCFSDKVVVCDDILYYLTLNTSQTSGFVSVNFAEMFASQWELIKNEYSKSNVTDNEYYHYAALRIFNNFNSSFKHFKDGGPVRDEYMNPIEISPTDRVNLINEIMDDTRIKELIYYSQA